MSEHLCLYCDRVRGHEPAPDCDITKSGFFREKKASEDQIGGDHYKTMVIQPSEFIHKNGLNWCEGSVVKYVCRHNLKGGHQDLLKARHYIDLLIEWSYGNGN